MFRSFQILSLMTVAVVGLAAAGCGGGDKNPGVELQPVSGKVLLDGSPVAGATVVFRGGEHGASGITNAAGEFKLTTFDPADGAKEGIYAVTITKAELVSADASYSDVNSPNYGKEAPPEAQGTRKYIIAEKFSKPETSGLTATVTSGVNEFTFEVTGG